MFISARPPQMQKNPQPPISGGSVTFIYRGKKTKKSGEPYSTIVEISTIVEFPFFCGISSFASLQSVTKNSKSEFVVHLFQLYGAGIGKLIFSLNTRGYSKRKKSWGHFQLSTLAQEIEKKCRASLSQLIYEYQFGTVDKWRKNRRRGHGAVTAYEYHFLPLKKKQRRCPPEIQYRYMHWQAGSKKSKSSKMFSILAYLSLA